MSLQKLRRLCIDKLMISILSVGIVLPAVAADFTTTEDLAKPTDPKDKVTLGYMYQHGIGVDQDDDKAIALYREAAETGLASAQYILGVSYDYGIGIR